MPVSDDTRARFEQLKDLWKKDTCFLSFHMVDHPAYQGIIHLGMPVVPILLEELRTDPDWWFYALMAITGENPCTEAMHGRLDLLSQAWIAWGLERGILK